MEIIWLRRALLDMQQASNYIEPHNPAAALKVRNRLRTAMEHLAEFPRAGRIGRKFGTREIVLTEHPYVIRYRLTGTGKVQILRIFLRHRMDVTLTSMLIGYARVSTQRQNLDRQIAALTSCSRIFCEKAAGKSIHNRPELEKAIPPSPRTAP